LFGKKGISSEPMSRVYLEHRDAYHVPGASSESEIAAAANAAAEALLSCDAWLITAGAGMGVDSGLPAFRGTKALWKDKEVSMSYEEMSDDKWFTEDPPFAWGVNYTQLEMYRKTEPHSGYHRLLDWTKRLGKPWCVFTSNIDGHFEKAGFEHERVVTCHGDMHHLQCLRRDCRADDPAENVWSASCIPSGLGHMIDEGSLRFKDAADLEAPFFTCPRCHGLCRPNVWFCHDRNHCLWEDEVARRQFYNTWVEEIHERKAKLVVIECGGGMDIPTVRCEGEDAVENAGEHSLLVRLNPTDCRVPKSRAVGLPLGASEGLSSIAAAMDRQLRQSGDRNGVRQRSGSRRQRPKATAKSPPAQRRTSPAPRRASSPTAQRRTSPAPRRASSPTAQRRTPSNQAKRGEGD